MISLDLRRGTPRQIHVENGGRAPAAKRLDADRQRDRCVGIVVDNLHRLRRGEPLVDVVDHALGC